MTDERIKQLKDAWGIMCGAFQGMLGMSDEEYQEFYKILTEQENIVEV